MAGIFFGRNKKFLLGFLAIVFFASGFWIIQTQTTEAQTSTLIANPLKWEDIISLIDAVVDFIFNLAVPLVILMVVLAAFLFMTAGGEPQKISAARNVILYALIGLLVITLAGALMAALKYAMGVP